ncbi:hypothetical protein IWQ55_004418 [Labrenzia sp. EL_208]|uniref:hypothetical protein n=1 Tax=Roseibium album TaxID=311410 RepID=UPI000CF16F20|nr:hypothetical protein [Labrenzia sp. EL_142]MBG6176337.1 hypothetical protein [Labrenzia sp. EL_132]MBG6199607.1 hypothetical protein [Labrenzia sp. EL_13]MBG6231194.1 hypothetical protein [Labrenzia sp. EL_208]
MTASHRLFTRDVVSSFTNQIGFRIAAQPAGDKLNTRMFFDRENKAPPPGNTPEGPRVVWRAKDRPLTRG